MTDGRKEHCWVGFSLPILQKSCNKVFCLFSFLNTFSKLILRAWRHAVVSQCQCKLETLSAGTHLPPLNSLSWLELGKGGAESSLFLLRIWIFFPPLKSCIIWKFNFYFLCVAFMAAILKTERTSFGCWTQEGVCLHGKRQAAYILQLCWNQQNFIEDFFRLFLPPPQYLKYLCRSVGS